MLHNRTQRNRNVENIYIKRKTRIYNFVLEPSVFVCACVNEGADYDEAQATETTEPRSERERTQSNYRYYTTLHSQTEAIQDAHRFTVFDLLLLFSTDVDASSLLLLFVVVVFLVLFLLCFLPCVGGAASTLPSNLPRFKVLVLITKKMMNGGDADTCTDTFSSREHAHTQAHRRENQILEAPVWPVPVKEI